MRPRRSWFRWIALLCLAILTGMLAGCASDSSSNTESLNIYEIWATSASFTAAAGDETARQFQLTLNNQFTEDDAVLYFTNRGAQQAGTATLGNLISTIWPRVYGGVAPNALLQGKTATNETVYLSCIIEKPVLNKATGQLSFSITYLDGRRPEAGLALTDLQLIITNNAATVRPEVWSHNLDGATATLEPSSSNDGSYTFRVQKAVGTVYGITCAPQRKTETITAKEYISGWNTRFGATPPNVSITYTDSTLASDGGVFTATLSNPVYDENTGSISFKATNLYSPLGPIGKTAVTLQAPTVFIDAGPGGFPTYADNVFSVQFRNSTGKAITVWLDGTQPPCSAEMAKTTACSTEGTSDTFDTSWKALNDNKVFSKSGTHFYIVEKDNKTSKEVAQILQHIDLEAGQTLRIVPPIAADNYPQWYFNKNEKATTAGVAAWVTLKGISMPAIGNQSKLEFNVDYPGKNHWFDIGAVDGLNTNLSMTYEGDGCGNDVNCACKSNDVVVTMPRVCNTPLDEYSDTNPDGCPYIEKTDAFVTCANPKFYPATDFAATLKRPDWVVPINKFTTDSLENELYKSIWTAAGSPSGEEMAKAGSGEAAKKKAYHIWWSTNPVGQGWINYLQHNKKGACVKYAWAYDEMKWYTKDGASSFDSNGNPPRHNPIQPLVVCPMKKNTYLNFDITKVM